MGTQQILMIILSVIIVGTAIAIGIQMFDTQLENNTRQAMATELMHQASQAQAWFRVPYHMRGGGNGIRPNGAVVSASAVDMIRFMGEKPSTPSYTATSTTCTYENLQGSYTLILQGESSTRLVTITAVSLVRDDIRTECSFPLAGSANDIVIRQL